MPNSPLAPDVIVLAGGRASRMGGVDKPGLVVGGRSMLETALAAAASLGRTVVVGPPRPALGTHIRQTREPEPGSGPVAALAAGLAALGEGPTAHIVVLAADLPFLTDSAISELLRHSDDFDAVFAADLSGRPQYLIGVWRTEPLVARLRELDTVINQPMKALVPLRTNIVALAGVDDCDTPGEIDAARAAFDTPANGDPRGTGTAATRQSASSDAEPLSLDQAQEILRDELTRLPERRAELHRARGAALAAPLIAAEALPRFDVSAMDGYAVAGEGPWELRADIGFAGGQRPDGLHPGEAVRIATGAQVPEGTTRVLRDEFARTGAANRLYRLPDAPARSDIRRRGEDRDLGDEIAPAGTTVTIALVSASTAVEVTTATVRGPVRARIVMTGDEIRSAGPLQAGQTRDSIGPILPDLLAAHGIPVLDQVHLRDTAHGFDQVLATATDCDLLVVVGATGGGAADQLRGALDRCGGRILVPRLALRPGGSTVVAELPTASTVLGLPGNPYAAIATLLALVPAIVGGRTGAPARRSPTGPLRNAAEISGPVTRIVPARYSAGGGWIGDPAIRTAHLGGLVDRDGLVVVAPGARDGDSVEFIPLP
ncbi:NTP transferase domain-containing protein [Nocardia sp. NBC_01329]|uniref:NTP transferase domain-containing protein n=1 Tax=Nocardia sp. NBC_01329 TaxID=2903594 RepID=UPI002E11BBD5|nr:NTP transferase domain-containing protein [Nocardia sp. NBC_01329]